MNCPACFAHPILRVKCGYCDGLGIMHCCAGEEVDLAPAGQAVHEREIERQLKVARQIMQRDRNLLAALAQL